MTEYAVTEDTLAEAFTAWLEDYQSNPAGYTDESGDPLSYGRACAKELLRILDGPVE